ncbi:IbrB-like domain-containing protein [Enterococcus faecium]|uniref:IbrB-like domain-containing protein n=1 Tax=Enterococcus faecium TaxID=1352 RepID=UPI003DA225CE
MKIDIPCQRIQMVPRDMIQANNYNPNHVPKDKMELLKQSIIDNGFCFPIVTIWSEEDGKYIIIDGFHRYTMCQPEWLDIDPVPVVVLKHDISQRMAATIQFNKARGVHELDGDADIVRSLVKQGMSDADICQHLGIDAETELRYKQLTGIVELFRKVNYSVSWSSDGDEKDGDDAVKPAKS